MEKKASKQLPKYLTKNELQSMLSACSNVRDELMMLFLYNVGARVSELVNFRIEDIDFENNTVAIFRGKGAKDRVVTISPDFAKLLKVFVGKKDKGALFLSNWDQPFTPRAIQKKVKSLARRSNLPYVDKITPHSLRHTHAVHALQSGVNIISIKKHLGHSNLRTTMVYTEISDEIVKKDFEDHNPFQLKKDIRQKSLDKFG